MCARNDRLSELIREDYNLKAGKAADSECKTLHSPVLSHDAMNFRGRDAPNKLVTWERGGKGYRARMRIVRARMHLIFIMRRRSISSFKGRRLP